MLTMNSFQKEEIAAIEKKNPALSRRKFLGYAGAATGLMAGLAACSKNSTTSDTGVDLLTGDYGILNYAYALEQLEAAFYTQVIATPYSGITADETIRLTEIRDHEIAHREFLKNALGAKAIVALEVNFTSINFASRDSVLATAKAFEDLGVSAYNGAGKLITNPDYLVLAGKIVSVEARHAAYIRNLVSAGSFADNTILDVNGLDKSRTPPEVLAIASVYIKTKINASNLPTS
jgi:hypothetical protein